MVDYYFFSNPTYNNKWWCQAWWYLLIYESINLSYGLSWLQHLSQMLDPRSSNEGSNHALFFFFSFFFLGLIWKLIITREGKNSPLFISCSFPHLKRWHCKVKFYFPYLIVFFNIYLNYLYIINLLLYISYLYFNFFTYFIIILQNTWILLLLASYNCPFLFLIHIYFINAKVTLLGMAKYL